jgi:hypothetical protein
MKIKEVTSEYIKFDNGNEITFGHCQNCCEWNYADFKQVDDIARATDFDPNLKFEVVENSGFRFGNEGKMFFVPCYSEQNGYYSNDVEIYYNNRKRLCIFADIV